MTERYLYDEKGRPTAVQPNWTQWTLPNPYVTGTPNTVTSHYDWQFPYHGMRWQWIISNNISTGLTGMPPWGFYYSGGGQWYDPNAGRMVQPDTSAAATGGNAYDPHMEAYHDPAWVTYAAGAFRWIGTAALTVASLGTYTAAEGALAFSIRQGLFNTAKVAGVGGFLGAVDSRLEGGSSLQGTYTGSLSAMALVGGLNLLPTKLAWGLGFALNAGLGGYGAYQSFTDPNRDRTVQGLFRIGTSFYFGARQLGYGLNIGQSIEDDGSIIFGVNRFFKYTGRNLVSPDSVAREYVQGSYLNPMTNQIEVTSDPLEADHFVGAKEITQMDNFKLLNREFQELVLNDLNNMQGLPKTFNTSKGGLDPSMCRFYKGQSLSSDYISRSTALEPVMRSYLQAKINFLWSVQR